VWKLIYLKDDPTSLGNAGGVYTALACVCRRQLCWSLSAPSITPRRYIRLNIVHSQAILKRFIELDLFIWLHTKLNSFVNSVDNIYVHQSTYCTSG